MKCFNGTYPDFFVNGRGMLRALIILYSFLVFYRLLLVNCKSNVCLFKTGQFRRTFALEFSVFENFQLSTSERVAQPSIFSLQHFYPGLFRDLSNMYLFNPWVPLKGVVAVQPCME